jgi:hypothetical protein
MAFGRSLNPFKDPVSNATTGIDEAIFDVKHGNFMRAPVDLAVGAVGARFPALGPVATMMRNFLIGDPVKMEAIKEMSKEVARFGRLSEFRLQRGPSRLRRSAGCGSASARARSGSTARSRWRWPLTAPSAVRRPTSPSSSS